MKQKLQNGFTMIEVAVVATVIIIIVSFNITSFIGIEQIAIKSVLQSDLTAMSTQIIVDRIINDTYPETLTSIMNDKNVTVSPGVSYQYTVDNNSIPKTFCLTATKGPISYKISQDGIILSGYCLDYGIAIHLDPANVTSYSGSGNEWLDISGNNNNGIMFNGVGYNYDNQGSMVFDGVNDYVDMPNTTNIFNNKNNITLITWANHSVVASSWKNIISKGSDLLSIQHSSDGKHIEFALQTSSGKVVLTSTSRADQNLGSWQQVATSWDGSVVKLFINGQLEDSKSLGGTFIDNAYNVNIGQASEGGRNFAGKIGDIRIFNHNLSDNEILQTYDNLNSRYGL